MKMKLFIILTLLVISYGQVYSCKCGPIRIGKEIDLAYDFIIGKVISEKMDTLTCRYSLDYSYEFEIGFSYKGQLTGRTTIFGGKGTGTCGAIFEKGKEYLVVVHKCDKGLYTLLCSDNPLTANASTEVAFLNGHFGKSYKLLKFESLIPIIFLTLIVLTATGLLIFNHYKKRAV